MRARVWVIACAVVFGAGAIAIYALHKTAPPHGASPASAVARAVPAPTPAPEPAPTEAMPAAAPTWEPTAGLVADIEAFNQVCSNPSGPDSTKTCASKKSDLLARQKKLGLSDAAIDGRLKADMQTATWP